MKTITQVRESVKSIGWKLQIKTFSFGTMASYYVGNFCYGDVVHDSNTELVNACQSLTSFLATNQDDLKAIAKEEGISGLLG